MKNLILSLLIVFGILWVMLIPFKVVHAGLLGLDSEIKGEYNLETNKSTLTSQVGKTVGMYGLSVSADVDFDVMEFAYDGMDFKAEYDVLQLNNASIYVSSGLDTNWAMEDITLGMSIKF
tara:strand:- start:235 stop:594 length:360 start_codon:yes stop_codon:yes gene_type:complete